MSKIEYKPTGVCCRQMTIEVENGILKDVDFVGGCNGNLKGIKSLLIGMKTTDIIERLEGITCGNKLSSCPDQLAKALKESQQ